MLEIKNAPRYDICNSTVRSTWLEVTRDAIVARTLTMRGTWKLLRKIPYKLADLISSSIFPGRIFLDHFFPLFFYVICEIKCLRRRLYDFERLNMIMHVYNLPRKVTRNSPINCVKKMFQEMMLVREFYDVKKRELLWKVFKLQMRNSWDNAAYAFGTQSSTPHCKSRRKKVILNLMYVDTNMSGFFLCTDYFVNLQQYDNTTGIL